MKLLESCMHFTISYNSLEKKFLKNVINDSNFLKKKGQICHKTFVVCEIEPLNKKHVQLKHLTLKFRAISIISQLLPLSQNAKLVYNVWLIWKCWSIYGYYVELTYQIKLVYIVIDLEILVHIWILSIPYYVVLMYQITSKTESNAVTSISRYG